MENDDISKLLRLKRYEQPPPAYFDDFLSEFHRRQRASMMKRPMWETMWDRLMEMAPSFRVPQFAYGAMFALAATASILIVSPNKQESTMALAKADAAIPSFSLSGAKPVTISDTVPVSARADGSLPPHYVLQSRPVNNEQPLSF